MKEIIKEMTKNVGFVDRIIRFVLFDFLISLTYLELEVSTILGAFGFWFAAYLLFTIVFGYDPIYRIFRIDSNLSSKELLRIANKSDFD